MREPWKTLWLLAAATACFITSIVGALYLIVQIKQRRDVIGALALAAACLGPLFGMIFFARVEYGEWMKGVPWWDRMKDGYRPPIKLPPND
jgi:hypothetical protein